MKKTIKENMIVCRCEDITYDEVVDAINEGFSDIESLKRYLKFSLGPCQGKSCIPIVESILARLTKKNIDEIKEPTVRPPVDPVPLKVLKSFNIKKEENNEK